MTLGPEKARRSPPPKSDRRLGPPAALPWRNETVEIVGIANELQEVSVSELMFRVFSSWFFFIS